MGHAESAMRVALTRQLAAGKISREGRGLYALNRAGLALGQAVDAWRQEPAVLIDWPGSWIAVHDATVQRSDKTCWRHHQLALRLRGFATFQPGLHLRPCNRPGGVAGERAALEALGLAEAAAVFLVSELHARDMQRALGLWPVAELLAGYDSMRQALREHRAAWPNLPTDQLVRESLLLGRAVVTQLVHDPMLPASLMPSGGPGRHALVKEFTSYLAGARRQWRQWMAK